ncbi:MAG TPA: hypothetical protein ENK66_06770 [Arcobacter sp.]|jgi:hypothetical protein|nr:hypothetical protein [Arcobacter sp.]
MDKSQYQKNLKELYFKNRAKNKKSNYSAFKTSGDILSSLAKQKQMSNIRQRAYIDLILKKILLQSHYNWISYAYVRNEKLIIYAKNHIAQSELNYQKEFILNSFHTIEKFQALTTVSILRDTNLDKKKNISFKISHFKERSYGIFDNSVTNKRLSKIIESIRTFIKKNN